MTAFDINSLITTLSCFGTYQKWKFLFISLAVAFSCVQYSYVFNTRSTTYRCFIDECDSSDNLTYEQPWLENAIPYDGVIFRKCERYAMIWDPDDSIQACEPESFNQSDIQRCDELVLETEVSTIEHDFDLTCEENLWMLTIVGSLDEIGKVVSSPFVGYFSDRYGRKVILITSLVMSATLGVVKAISPSYIMFAVMEFATACFTSAIYGCVYIFAVELLVPSERVFGSTITAMAFPCGQILVGVAAWFAPTWRIMLLILHAPGLLFICFYWLLDDSLCFLIANGRVKKTEQVIKKIAKANKVDIPDNLEAHLKQAIRMEKHNDTKSENVDEDEDNTIPSETVCQIFNYPSLMLRVLNCSFTWISCTFVYYGLTVYSVSLTGNIYLNFIIMAVIELPAYVVCYYILDLFGRRYTSGGSLLISGAACLACAFIPTEMWVVQLVLPMVGKFAATLAYKTVYIYTAEMFPTTLRHTLLAFCSMFGRIGSIAAPQLPILSNISPILPPILFGILGMSAGIFVFFLPETTGCKLPDTLEEAVQTGREDKPSKTV